MPSNDMEPVFCQDFVGASIREIACASALTKRDGSLFSTDIVSVSLISAGWSRRAVATADPARSKTTNLGSSVGGSCLV